MADKSSSQQTADALFLLDALQHVTSTVVINAGEIAAQKDAKVNTIQKRFTTLKQRYNLNIQTTAAVSTVTSSPSKPKPVRVAKTPISKKTSGKKMNSSKVAAIIGQLEESDEDSAQATATRSENSNGEQMRNVGRSTFFWPPYIPTY